MRSFAVGFVKEAAEEATTSAKTPPSWMKKRRREIVGASVGALVGAVATAKKDPVTQIVYSGIGSSVGWGLGAGLRGLSETPSFEGLTPDEIEVLHDEADRQAKMRTKRRLSGVGMAALTFLSDPTSLAVVRHIPDVTIAPYSEETERLQMLADDFRRAHAKAKAREKAE